jgi:hypothetical protein
MSKQYGFVTEPAVVMEMTSDGNGEIDVPVEEGLVAKLIEGDKDPMFVTIEVINEGVSRNGRAYDKATIISLAEQINAKRPDGYYGHLTDEERQTKFPEPQTIWIGAKVTEVGGKTRLFAKGYVLPEAKSLRSYLRKAKAASKNIAVSVYGLARVVKNGAIQTVKSMNLESIDWARPGSEGVLNMGMFSVTAEMSNDSKLTTGEEETMDKVEVLKAATVDELKEANPTVVSEMIAEGSQAKATELETVVSEMTEVRTVLGLEEDASAVETVKEMTERLQGYELDTQLSEKVESATARKVVKELVISEMSSGTPVSEAVDKVLGSETGQAIVKEMLDVAPRVAPKTVQPLAKARKFTKKS